MSKTLYVLKRNGLKQEVSFDKIYKRIKFLVKEPCILNGVDASQLSQVVIQGLFNGIRTSDIDVFTADKAASLSIQHIDYGILAGRIVNNNHHKNTLTGFKDKMELLYRNVDLQGKPNPLIDYEFFKFVCKNQKRLEMMFDYDRDYLIDFFGFRTLERSYMLRLTNEKLVERPQDIWMRESIFLNMDSDDYTNEASLKKIEQTYDMLSTCKYTHATPTIFNAGTPIPQCSSCYLLGTEDSSKGIMKTMSDVAQISKYSGGIGVHISNWRSSGTVIRSTNGRSDGPIPFMKILNATTRAFNQGGGKRKGSAAVYMEPHHPNIIEFLGTKRTQGDENGLTRDLFIALYVNDLFMERVEKDKMWSLIDPDEHPGLSDVHGEEYRTLYLTYEKEKKYKSQLKARDIWEHVYLSQKESGLPYILNKDKINECSNQKNLGTIKSSNLCCEITLFSNKDEYAVCNLASVCLPRFVKERSTKRNSTYPKDPYFDFLELAKVVELMTENINKVIDRTWYPVPETVKSNLDHRPIGIGVQGLSDVFYMFRHPFGSDGARELNKKIFECIYYAAMSKSAKMARDRYIHLKSISGNVIATTSGSYPSMLKNGGSPISKGIFHWEMYGLKSEDLSGMFDWESLRQMITKFGVRNSQLIALMPTGSTSQIMGNIECFEPLTSNIFRRKTLAGDFIVINKYLIHDLIELGVWSTDILNYLKVNEGSIQHIEGIPKEMKELYKTVWELKQKHLIDMAADRQAFVDQSQSLNLHVQLTKGKFHSMLMYGWKKGLKTLSYYMRSRPAVYPQKFTVDPEIQRKIKENTFKFAEASKNIESIPQENEEICLVCSS